MKKIVVLGILALVILAGCASSGTVTNSEGKKVLPPVVNMVKPAVDLVCENNPFNTGFLDRFNQNRKGTLTVQQTADLEYLKGVCKKAEGDRTPYEYGWVAGAFIDDSLAMIIPSLGSDALSALMAAGMLIK